MFAILFSVKFVAFPDRKDSIFNQISKDNFKLIHSESSGSMGFFRDGKCRQTYPNQTLITNEMNDWCSNLAPSKEEKDKPWIMYSIPNKAFKITGYSIRNGCCRYVCCCIDDNTDIDYCCCDLYSFSLHGSNDNLTWKLIHKVEKDSRFYHCQYKTYELDSKTEAFRYLKLVQDEEYPGCPKCMQINQIDFYGSLIDDHYSFDQEDDNDETISIIGKIKNRND